MSEVVRTPDSRFEGLSEFPYAPHWFEWEGLRLHYLDEGEGRPVVLFHGEPTWCFLYRKVMVPLRNAGYRVVAPDYPGFGKSDKPTDPAFYTYDTHVAAMAALLSTLGLSGATAVVQDWGGPIGLRLAAEHPDWFGRLSILNTGLFTGAGRASEGFLAWRSFVERTPDLPIRLIMERSAVQPWDDAVFAGYEAPFPDAASKVGAHRFPLIVPLSEEDDGAADMKRTLETLRGWTAPAQVLFSTEDPIFSVRVGERWVERVPGATALETVEGAGHFLQEDRGDEVGRRIAAFLERTD